MAKKQQTYEEAIKEMNKKKSIVVEDFDFNSEEIEFYESIKFSKRFSDNKKEPKKYTACFSSVKGNDNLDIVSLFSDGCFLNSYVFRKDFFDEKSDGVLLDSIKKEIDKYFFVFENKDMLLDIFGDENLKNTFLYQSESSCVVTRALGYYVKYDGNKFTLYDDYSNKIVCVDECYEFVVEEFFKGNKKDKQQDSTIDKVKTKLKSVFRV